MARLIDAEALTQHVIQINDIDTGTHRIPVYMLDTVHNAPTVDAAPVMYADWEWHRAENKAPVLRCTACKSPAFCTIERDNMIEFARTPYCSHCGARMKKA